MPDGQVRHEKAETGSPDYIEKAEMGAMDRALTMCGYGTVQAPEFDEQDRLSDAPVEKWEIKTLKSCEWFCS